MTGERKSQGSLGRGIAIAAALSAGFLGLTVLTSAVFAALIVLPVAVVIGAERARRVPRATPHTLVESSFEPAAIIRALKVGDGSTAKKANPAA